MSANDSQVGGSYYKSTYQHWDLVRNTGMGYLEGCATKYIVRHRKKNGLADLEKARHYLEKLREVSTQSIRKPRSGALFIAYECKSFAEENLLTKIETILIVIIASWEDNFQIDTAIELVDQLIKEYEPVLRPGTPEDGGHHAPKD